MASLSSSGTVERAVSDSRAVDSASTGLPAALAGISFVAHMFVAGKYRYFRDELYYIADGRHHQQDLPMYVFSGPNNVNLARLWPSLKSFS